MATSANQLTERSEDNRIAYPVAASVNVPEGTMVFITAAGYADDDTASGVNAFAGIAIESADNSAGSDGDKTVEVWARGVFDLPGSGLAQSLVGNKIYASDNFTVTGTDTNNTLAGYCAGFISATKVRVRLRTGEA